MSLPIEIGLHDFLPRFQLLNHRGRASDLLRHAMGKPIALFFISSQQEIALALLRRIVEAGDPEGGNFHILAVSDRAPEESASLAQQSGFERPILYDEKGQLARAMGHLADGEAAYPPTSRLYVADSNRRLAGIFPLTAESDVEGILRDCAEKLAPAGSRVVQPTAPILYVRDALDRRDCEGLIRLWHEGGNSETGVFRQDQTQPGGQIDRSTKSRRDHVVTESDVARHIVAVLNRRVVPEIFKAFSFRVKYVKEFKIGCYKAEDSGVFKPHRDNFAERGGRRFAFSLILNAEDFEGGELRFPEYGGDLFRPGTGDAVVFSCYHVHEVLPVTRGERFVLLGFFYGEEGEG